MFADALSVSVGADFVYRVELRKVDRWGRLVLPADWRGDLGSSKEVIPVRGPGFIKVIPTRTAQLKRFFDTADLGVDAIGDWSEFEKKVNRKEMQEAAESMDRFRESTRIPGWSGAREIRDRRDAGRKSR
jgi:bifunctional DNA-binding transcriptional regulator/antitoxin component of YhaV-PrlF toxin-antitoxin module